MSQQHDNDHKRPSRKPDFVAYTIQKYGDDQTAWNRIGAAFQHSDGAGLDVILSAHPVDGRLTLREPRRDAEPENDQRVRRSDRSKPRERRPR